MEWIQFLNQEEESHSKLDHYLAQIAMEVCRNRLEKPGAVKLRDFLMVSKEEQASREDKLKKSKSAWLNLVGLQDPEGN